MMANNSNNTFDFAVVGGGLFGSAAARHLATQGKNVVLFAPEEPADVTSHDGVFASHYDEARITRILDVDELWSDLARSSISRYKQIENDSGINFHYPARYLFLCHEEIDSINANARVAEAHNVPFELLDSVALTERMPFLAIKSDERALLEPPPAGYVNPRALVRAQIKCATSKGGHVINQMVSKVEEVPEGVRIITSTGENYFANNVLLATSIHTNNLLDSPLDLAINGSLIVFAKLSDSLIESLSDMPSISHRPASGINTYLLPPVTYPNGATYIKIGVSNSTRTLHEDEEIREWFRSGSDPSEEKTAQESITNLIPLLKNQPMHFETCATTHTISGYPYIGKISNRINVCVGGNGYGAKSSDEIGRLGASVLQCESIDERFQPRFIG
jgi:sarcosine oxidase